MGEWFTNKLTLTIAKTNCITCFSPNVSKHYSMSKHLFITAIIVFILAGCSSNRNTVLPIQIIHTVLFEADGLTTGSDIYLDGKLIGEVQDLSMNSEAHILVKMKIDSVCSIDENSFVKIVSDILGTKSLEITSELGKNYISNMDTLKSKKIEEYPSIQLEPDTNLDSLFQELLDTNNR